MKEVNIFKKLGKGSSSIILERNSQTGQFVRTSGSWNLKEIGKKAKILREIESRRKPELHADL